MKNPLNKRLLRELTGDIGKYIVIFILMTFSIGFVSGFLVAGESMIKAYNESFEKYSIEDGNFRTEERLKDSQKEWIEAKGVSVYENFVTSRQMIMIILMLVVVVAAFYTASVAQQMVQDDIQDIAIVKLIGSSNTLVRKSAFLSVYAVTLAGMILGIGLGLLIGCNLGPILTWLSSLGFQSLSFYLLDFSITIPWLSIAIICALLMVISFVSIRISLIRTKTITPMRLFTSL